MEDEKILIGMRSAADQIVRIEMLLGRRMWLLYYGINSYVASTEASDLVWI